MDIGVNTGLDPDLDLDLVRGTGVAGWRIAWGQHGRQKQYRDRKRERETSTHTERYSHIF